MQGIVLNDIHSKLNSTAVREIVTVRSEADVAAALLRARTEGLEIAVSGGRHSMGGQQFRKGALQLDMRSFNRVLAFDAVAATVTVEPGIMWPELLAQLEALQQDRSGPFLSFRQKQTGGDRFTIGGSLSANIHGRGLRFPPFIDDVASLRVMLADGTIVEASRTREPELFSLVCGGYGLFGIVLSVTLRLFPRQLVQRLARLEKVDCLDAAFRRRIEEGCLYGDFQFSCAEDSADFLRTGMFSCYRSLGIDDGRSSPAGQRALSPAGWRRLIHLAHVDKQKAFSEYADYYLSTDGQLYGSDTHQMSIYIDDYHQELDAACSIGPASEMISELFVPRALLPAFLRQAAADLRKRHAHLIYGTVRLIEEDQDSFLPWARQPWACVIFNLHTESHPSAVERTADDFRYLIDRALECGGSYYLTYHRWARRDQVLAAHPHIRDFLRKKTEWDPRGTFASDWHLHLRHLLG